MTTMTFARRSVDALRFEGFAVDAARDGKEGLAWLRDHGGTSCLVVLDLMMPVMDGRVFLDLKAKDPSLALIPVVVLTAGGDCKRAEGDRQDRALPPQDVPDLGADGRDRGVRLRR